MSSYNEKLFEKLKNMDSYAAVECLLSILLTSNDWKEKLKVTELLLLYDDFNQFSKVKVAYLNEIHPKSKINLIEFMVKNYENNAISFLIEKYKNENDWKVRKSIIEKVGTLNKEDAVYFLLEAMQDNDVEVKKTAIVYLGKVSILPNKALKPLFEQLKFRNAEINDILINLIVKIVKKGDIHDILEFKQIDNININRAIPIILGKIGSKEVKQYIIDFLHDDNAIVRKNAVEASKNVFDTDDIDILVKMLDDDNNDVKVSVIDVLGSIQSEKIIKPLFEMLKSDDESIQRLILKSLSSYFINFDNTKIIQGYLSKGNINARKGAIKLLGMIAKPDSIESLINALNSRNSLIRRTAVTSIIKVSKKNHEVKDIISSYLKSKEWQIRKYIPRILGIIRDENTIEPLFELLNDPKSGVRSAAITSLSKFSPQKVINLSKAYINNGNRRSKRATVKLLIKIGDENSLQYLVPLLNDEDLYVKNWAARGVGKLKNLKNIRPLIEMLINRDTKLKLSAIITLGEIGKKEAIEPLIQCLRDDDWNVRKEAEHSLNKINPNWMDLL